MAIGISTLTLATLDATLLAGDIAGSAAWIPVGVIASFGAISASLQTFQRYGEYAQEHREVAEAWAAIRREIELTVAIHPSYLAIRGDANSYIEDLQERIARLTATSVRAVGRARWRAMADQQRTEFLAATLAASGRREVPRFSAAVRNLLEDWERRAAAMSYAHLANAERLTALNLSLGVPAIVLMGLVSASAFIDHGYVLTRVPLVVSGMGVLVAVVASLNTFLRTRLRAQAHGIAAESWAALRHEIGASRTFDPSQAADDPKTYLDGLRSRMDALADHEPAISHRTFMLASQDERLAGPGAAARFEAVFPGVRLLEEDAAASLGVG